MMRKSGLAQKCDRLAQDMYENTDGGGEATVGLMDGFEVEVGLHQGLALSAYFTRYGDGETDR